MSDLTPSQIAEINRLIAAGKYRHEEPAAEPKRAKPATRKAAPKKAAEDQSDE